MDRDGTEALHPAARAVLDRKLPVAVRSSVYLVGAVIGCSVLWASLAKVDRIVTARGRTATTERPMVVQPFERGVVRSIEVEVGAQVQRGQVLVTLDPTLAETTERDLLNRREMAAAQVRRLSAELDDLPFEAGEPGAAADLEGRLTSRRRAEFDARLAAYDASARRIAARQEGVRATLRGLEARLAIAREVELMREQLRARDAGSLLAVLQARSERLQIEEQLTSGGAELQDLSRQAEGVRTEHAVFERGWRREVAQQLIEARRELESASQQLAAARRRSDLVVLRAPSDGIVLEVARRSVGSVVQEAETLVTLVPKASALEAEVEIGSEDIGHVHAGDTVRVKLGALPFQRHGILPGVVRVVNADVLPSGGPGAREGRLAHRARIAIDGSTLRGVPAHFRLLPGMEVIAEVKVGRRSVISYFLEPLVRIHDESLKEL